MPNVSDHDHKLGLHLAVMLRLRNPKARDKLLPLLRTSAVGRVTVVRHAAVNIESPKLKQVINHSGLQDDAPPRSRWLSLRNLVATFANGWQVARHDRPDAFIGYNLVPYGVIAWTLAHWVRSPVIISLVGSDFDLRLRTPVLGWLLYRVLRTSDSVVVYGHAAREKLLMRGLDPANVFVLPNTVDTDLFTLDPAVQADNDLIYIGNLLDFKRVDLILQSLALVHRTHPAITLRIVGEGPEREALERLAARLNLQRVVTFTGWSDDIVGHLRRSKVLLLLSEHEGLPAVLIEALSMGLPVVATNVGAVASVVKDQGNGFLLPPAPDPARVAECIEALLTEDDQYQRMSQQALLTRQTHSYDEAARIWTEILSTIPRAANRQERV